MKILYVFFTLCLAIYIQAEHTEPIPITIWVHGTLVVPNFFLADFFYRKLGMVRAEDYHPRYHSRDMAQSLCRADPKSYQFDHFYFWGWSGNLSRKARKCEAQQLYTDIAKLLKMYHQQYPDAPLFIRLISHSHGGNVLLNLSQVENACDPLVFDELILLSCPVQYATKEYVKCSCFKKIYSFYSSDLYQVIDFQFIKRNGRTLKMHSGRRFEEVSNLHQSKVKINGWGLMHIEFMLDKFLKHIPMLCRELDTFYDNLSLKEREREKLLCIRTCGHKSTIHRKLF